MPAMCSQVVMLLTKWLKLKNSMTPPPCSNTQWNRWPNSGKLSITVFKLMSRRKLRNSEMEETWRAKKEWRCGERSCPRQHNTLTSSPLVPTHELSECQNLWSFIFMFLIFIEVSINRDIDWIFGQRWLISTSVPSLLLTGEGVSNLEFHYWLCQPILWVYQLPFGQSWYLWKKKFQIFRYIGPWTRISFKYGK